MAWTTPTTQSSGALITASIWNGDLVDNLNYLKASPTLGTPTVDAVVLATVAGATPPAATLYKDSMVSAWVSITYSAGTPAISDDYNVSSLTDHAVGDVSVTYATALSVSTYAVCVCPTADDDDQIYCSSRTTAASRYIIINDDTDTASDGNLTVVIVGGWQ